MLILHRMMNPASYPAEAAERCPELLASWLAHAPGSQPAARDFEDWAENAAMLQALARHGDVTLVEDGPRYRMSGDNTPAVARRPGAPRAVMYGLFKSSDAVEFPIEADLVWNNADAVHRVQDYASSPVFLARCGRPFHVCDMTGESVVAALKALHDDGRRRGFIKSRAKGFAYAFDMGEDPTRLMSDMDPEQDVAWTIVHREGERSALYVQGAFRPTYEYRTVVVGDRVVCGAACIEEYTPLDSHGLVFDDRFQRLRGQSPIAVVGGLAETYRDFATEFARAWAAEHGSDMAYSLDLAIDDDTGDVVAIELNPMTNLGLYANRADLIAAAMVAGLDEARIAA